jgi:hypothetical protein
VGTGSREENASNKNAQAQHVNLDLIIFDCDGVLPRRHAARRRRGGDV